MYAQSLKYSLLFFNVLFLCCSQVNTQSVECQQTRKLLKMAEESIYDLIPKPKKEKKKPARYKSRYPGNVAPSYSTFGRAIGAQHTTTNVSGKLIPPETSHQYKNAGATFGSPNKHKADFQAFKSRKAKELPKRSPLFLQQ